MADEKNNKEVKHDEEAKRELTADRDDALGYSRQQITFDPETDKEDETGVPRKTES